MDFPQPQTLGRTRGVNVVPSDPNAGLLSRPTAYESQSLLDQVLSYVNNYGGSVATSQAVKAVETQQKAVPIGNTARKAFDTFNEVLGSTRSIESTWKTIADKIIEDRGLVIQSDYPGADVPGPIPAPRVENYGGADTRDKAFSDIKTAAEGFVEQVKGLFNLSYDGPQKQTGVPSGKVYSIRGVNPQMAAASLLLGLIFLG